MGNSELTKSIIEFIVKKPRHFAEVVQEYANYPYRDVLKSWSNIREKGLFKRDDEGHFLINSVENASKEDTSL